MFPEGGEGGCQHNSLVVPPKKGCRPPSHRLINGTALKKALFLANLFPQSKEHEMYIINMNMNYTR